MSKNTSLSPDDLRVRRTRKLLSDALVSLLEEHPFEAISVREICERAMVHRATFYTHFTDKYDLLKYVLQSLREDLTQIQRKEQQREEGRNFHLGIIEYVVAHQPLFSLLLVEQEEHDLAAMMRHQIAETAEDHIKELQKQGARYHLPIPIMAQFFAGAVLAVIAWWLENEIPISAEELTRHLDQLLSKEYEHSDTPTGG